MRWENPGLVTGVVAFLSPDMAPFLTPSEFSHFRVLRLHLCILSPLLENLLLSLFISSPYKFGVLTLLLSPRMSAF